MTDKKIKIFLAKITQAVERYLNSQFGLNIEDSKIKNIKHNIKEMKPYLEKIYMFRYVLFVECRFNLSDLQYKTAFINAIRKIFSEQSIAETKINWIQVRKK